jgi:hypothetical protein
MDNKKNLARKYENAKAGILKNKSINALTPTTTSLPQKQLKKLSRLAIN